MGQLIDAEWMNLSGNDKNKITGKKYQPVMSVTGLNDQGLSNHFLPKYIGRYFLTKSSEIVRS